MSEAQNSNFSTPSKSGLFSMFSETPSTAGCSRLNNNNTSTVSPTSYSAQ